MYVRELRVSYLKRQDLPLENALNPLSKPGDAAQVLRAILENEAVEGFGLLFLTTNHRLLSYHQLSRGTIDSTPASPRDVFQAALLGHAACIVLAHNHPSGDPTPSRDDCDLTRRLCQAGELMDIAVVDHIIIGHGNYFSFREARRL